MQPPGSPGTWSSPVVHVLTVVQAREDGKPELGDREEEGGTELRPPVENPVELGQRDLRLWCLMLVF